MQSTQLIFRTIPYISRSFDEDMLKFWIKAKAAFNCLIIS